MAAARGGDEGTKRLKLYADMMSQPSRAVTIFCRLNDLPVDVAPVYIHRGDTKGAAYRAINPLGKVPMLEDPWVAGGADGDAGSGLRLPESAAIMSYLSYRFSDSVAEHWYPRVDSVHRARVDAALHWYQGNIRAGAMRVSFHKVVAQRLGLQGDERVAQDGLNTLKLALSALESYWLAGGSRPFMTGGAPCVADLLCACELEQLRMLQPQAHGLSMRQILAPYAAVRAWQLRLRAACEPHYDDVHAVLMKAVAAAAKQAEAAAPLAKL
ncbi:hypothetical protein GPECTOR_12g395 [Gonium pectorale]|uniref:GST N-terminal domain-containing protein n=1 Tax=Gonium pectorale TaxID=33097 RepID=A0A150GNL6_GONPE|nr:hypothetical protein GPECTOR_12g395 [Gonium pectorale]|eukprot:KXZ51433.1 hypothetical protein GPECTOR_12g395 [Gonium pectorale]